MNTASELPVKADGNVAVYSTACKGHLSTTNHYNGLSHIKFKIDYLGKGGGGILKDSITFKNLVVSWKSHPLSFN